MDRTIEHRFRELSHLIGSTPLLAIEMRYRGRLRRVYAKAEHLNLTGSVKDRMALHVLRKAYNRGELEPGTPIVEVTSGNTGISFAAIGRALGHPVTIFMPDWMSRERIDLIRSFGAQCHLVSAAEGGFPGCIDLAERFAKENPGCFLPRQFSNVDNPESHQLGMGPEIWSQMGFEDLEPDAFVAGVGTGGTVMGVGAYLREKKPTISVHPLEPANSPTLRTGHKIGCHRIQGISDEFIPPILDLAALDEIVSVDDGDAIIMTQRLGRELGLGVGISSGANLLGALMVQDLLGDVVVATVFPDDNKKYLSTDLLRDEPVGKEFMTPHIELLDFSAFKRACATEAAGTLPAPTA